jgi:hypothetical protein
LFFVSSLFLIQVLVLFSFKQPLFSKSGKIKLWDEDIYGPENSQHLTDWYTPTHVLHGFIFYALAYLLLPNFSFKSKFLIALGSEVGWELVENSPIIINRYRETALAQGYSGDAIINSVADTFAMAVGFFLASKFPPWITLSIAIAEEVIAGYFIHDNLILNVIQLMHPFDVISQWQTQTMSKRKKF